MALLFFGIAIVAIMYEYPGLAFLCVLASCTCGQ